MKKLFLFFALASTVAFTSCSKDQDDTDAILGTWVSEFSSTPTGGATTSYTDEWVFKNDRTGHYKEMMNDEVDYETAFRWAKIEDSYTVDYVDEEAGMDTFTIGEELGHTTLEEGGEVVALKE
ncbi:hypothetical protein ZORO111903_03585 [Zobellia roscoffensis]|uniref:hypothetical protein n=1 Tax=Zobellia roscoffensis TaxID=2779508 RepID=UPI00188B5E9B|nr:hypothetical protein [Zobellia roscoffensis]